MRTKGVNFSCSSRAIVLGEIVESVEEHPMMIGKIRLDKKMSGLIDALSVMPGMEFSEASNNRIKASYQGRICYLPPRYLGNAQAAEIKRQLTTLGMPTTTEDDFISHMENAVSSSIAESIGKFVEPSSTTPSKIMDIELSHETRVLLESLKTTLSNDISLFIAKKAAEQVEESDSDQWQRIAEEAEDKLAAARKERDAAVRDLVSQRDEARKEAAAAKTDLAEMRSHLNGLQKLFQAPST